MRIDIDQLNETELVDLNHRVVARLKFMREMRAHAQMLDFRIGQRVAFQPDGYPELVGVIAKYNRKTVTVIVESGQQWNVWPGHLRAVEPGAAAQAEPAPVLQLRSE
ncbi:MAG: hypothetical protein Q8L45_04200 [Xanthomonadaceae bacterium]|nr:hypothetical protein [Xanthomonadaceae bacterium]MDP2185260.1 hypothetical protein [Xanthomonadales bacterium]MDZ4115556.1 hypothetical protein [Xanthomonadaceae bacterium]